LARRKFAKNWLSVSNDAKSNVGLALSNAARDLRLQTMIMNLVFSRQTPLKKLLPSD
jgi:hypothetical protein